MIWIPIGILAVLVALFLYWALWITEGAYLGRRVVALLYDLTPAYYDRIKEITWRRDRECLADPMQEWLKEVRQPLVLDVGTGSGRLPKALLSDERFDGQVWGLDLALGMLRRARDHVAPFGSRCTLIWEDADELPFPDETFDVVTCLEVLEFTPSPERTLGELMRVLRPGGVLLLTNRIGRARWFPGRTYSDDALVDLLCGYPLSRIEIHTWNTFYDQVWVRKAGEASTAGRGGEQVWTLLAHSQDYVLQEGIVRKKREQMKKQDWKNDPPVRPQLYVSVLLVMVMIVLAFMGQWDWVLAVFIGLLVGNGLTALSKS